MLEGLPMLSRKGPGQIKDWVRVLPEHMREFLLQKVDTAEHSPLKESNSESWTLFMENS
jgi:hypothetical protein